MSLNGTFILFDALILHSILELPPMLNDGLPNMLITTESKRAQNIFERNHPKKSCTWKVDIHGQVRVSEKQV